MWNHPEIRQLGGGGMSRRVRATLIGGLALRAVLGVIGGATGSPSATQPAQLPAAPTGLVQTWIASFHLSGHVFRPGQRITATVKVAVPTCYLPEQCVQTADWTMGGTVLQGCKEIVPKGTPTVTCTVKAGAATTTWVVAEASFQNPTGTPAYSQDYYAVVGKDDAVIDGTIKDKDGGPVAGVTVHAYGIANGNSGVSTVTGPNGAYVMNVDPGSYHVVPTGGPQGKSKASFKPTHDTVTVKAGQTVTSNFLLDAGLELQLNFAKTAVAADGFQVVTGTIKTTEFGKPKAGVNVQLTPMSDVSYDEAVTTAPRATICTGATRIWPLGAAANPSGAPVNITTDANGEYDFSITVGTTPGTWSLDAWARTSDGSLSTDTTAASENTMVKFTALGATPLTDFVTEFDRLKSTPLIQRISSDPASMVSTLSQLASQTVKGVQFGGLGFAETAAADGTSLLVFPADHPPLAKSSGEIDPVAGNGADLVLPSSEWSGKGLANLLNAADFQAVLSGGELPDLPTLSEWASGARVKGWSLKHNTLMQGSQNLQELGWAYPGITTPGACY
jgi:hypothetical protein